MHWFGMSGRHVGKILVTCARRDKDNMSGTSIAQFHDRLMPSEVG